MPDLNDLSRPVTTDTEPNVLDTLRAHIVRAATWTGWGATANKVAGMMSAVTTAVSGGRSLRLYRRNDGNTSDEEIVSLPGVSVGGNAGTASAVAWSGVTGKPSTVAGYGITDMNSQSVAYASSAGTAGAAPWSGITGKPSTLAGYGITDAPPLVNATGVGSIVFGVYRTKDPSWNQQPVNGTYADYPIGRVVTGINPASIWSTTDRVNLMSDAYTTLPGSWKFQCGMANSFGHSMAVMNNNVNHAVYGIFQRIA